MKAGDLAELALRNLREAVLRNSLTTLGVAVGVASLVAMLSLGVGLQELASRRLSNSGLFDTVLVMPRRNMENVRRANTAAPLVVKEAPALDEEARNKFEHLANVVEVYPQIRFPTEIRFDGKPYSTIVAGVPDSSRGNGAYDGIQGSFFSSPSADEAILQIELAKTWWCAMRSGRLFLLKAQQATQPKRGAVPAQEEVFPSFRARRSCTL
jgi:ABC-type antimicrobial peptide transport system permease subunit